MFPLGTYIVASSMIGTYISEGGSYVFGIIAYHVRFIHRRLTHGNQSAEPLCSILWRCFQSSSGPWLLAIPSKNNFGLIVYGWMISAARNNRYLVSASASVLTFGSIYQELDTYLWCTSKSDRRNAGAVQDTIISFCANQLPVRRCFYFKHNTYSTNTVSLTSRFHAPTSHDNHDYHGLRSHRIFGLQMIYQSRYIKRRMDGSKRIIIHIVDFS